jgi:hypothetical protein
MLASRLIHLIEDNSDELARGLLEKLQRSPRTAQLAAQVPAEELHERTYEIYRNLTDFLGTTAESELERRYSELGARRAAQGVPFSHFLWAVLLTKQHLHEFIQREGFLERPMELVQQLELLRSLDQFFNRALYYAAVGYERARAAHAA